LILAWMIDQIKSHPDELRALCQRLHVRRLDLFGSTVRGDFDPGCSDFDFVVEFDRGAPQHTFDAYFGLKEELEALLGRKVDLVELSAVRNPCLRASIKASPESVFGADQQ
jgi:predicted nucleotidyltransferase